LVPLLFVTSAKLGTDVEVPVAAQAAADDSRAAGQVQGAGADLDVLDIADLKRLGAA
jgi:hypothetical protein